MAPSLLEQKIHSWLGRRYFRFKLLPDKHAIWRVQYVMFFVYRAHSLRSVVFWKGVCWQVLFRFVWNSASELIQNEAASGVEPRNTPVNYSLVAWLQCRSAVWPKRRWSKKCLEFSKRMWFFNNSWRGYWLQTTKKMYVAVKGCVKYTILFSQILNVWSIYLYIWVLLGVNVGKYTIHHIPWSHHEIWISWNVSQRFSTFPNLLATWRIIPGIATG